MEFTKSHLVSEVTGNFSLAKHSNLESAKNNSSLEYLTKDSTPKSVGVDFELFDLESTKTDFNMEFAQEKSIPKSIVVKFIVGVIMIDYVFIPTNELTPRGQKFIHTFETIFVIKDGFKHLNFSIKERIIHSVFPLSLQYCYVMEIHTNFLLVKMRGIISKEMAKKMKNI